MPPTGPPRPEYDQKPIHGPGFRPAEGPIGPQAERCQIRPIGLQFRGVREGRCSGAYKQVLVALNQRGGTKLPPPRRCVRPSVPVGATNRDQRVALVPARTGTKGWHWSRFVPPTGTNGLAQRRGGGSLVPPCQLRGARSGL